MAIRDALPEDEEFGVYVQDENVRSIEAIISKLEPDPTEPENDGFHTSYLKLEITSNALPLEGDDIMPQEDHDKHDKENYVVEYRGSFTIGEKFAKVTLAGKYEENRSGHELAEHYQGILELPPKLKELYKKRLESVEFGSEEYFQYIEAYKSDLKACHDLAW